VSPWRLRTIAGRAFEASGEGRRRPVQPVMASRRGRAGDAVMAARPEPSARRLDDGGHDERPRKPPSTRARESLKRLDERRSEPVRSACGAYTTQRLEACATPATSPNTRRRHRWSTDRSQARPKGIRSRSRSHPPCHPSGTSDTAPALGRRARPALTAMRREISTGRRGVGRRNVTVRACA
jgi:hypothetical protein